MVFYPLADSRNYPLATAHSTWRTMKSLILTLLLFGLCHPLSSAQPNIVLLMGDDHGWEETGYNGHPHVKTPVLDEMAAMGLRLENFYAGHPSCSPTRASFLTGRHPNRMGTFAPGWSFRPEEITIAKILKQAGYQLRTLWQMASRSREGCLTGESRRDGF